MRVAIIGGGAAGCFAAVNIKRFKEDCDVAVFEAKSSLLAKVALTGGGRCNITNTFEGVSDLSAVYPRGHRLIKRLFNEFDHNSTLKWFENEGVRFISQSDRRVFPASGDAMEIVGTLERLLESNGVTVKTSHAVKKINHLPDGRYEIEFMAGSIENEVFDKVLVTVGGLHRGNSILDGLGIEIKPPVPSLFGFNIGVPGGRVSGPEQSPQFVRDAALSSLMGTSVDNVSVWLTGTKLRAEGPLLITDWGMSGPAILRLSSYAAPALAECGYVAGLSVNWLGQMTENDAREMLTGLASENPRKQVSSTNPKPLNGRLWAFLLDRSGLAQERKWAEIGNRGINRLLSTLISDSYQITGRNAFKGEFVTCGGVALSSVDPATLECRKHKGLYFAGEILDIDAVTGGFNLQSAWTTGYVAAKSLSLSRP